MIHALLALAAVAASAAPVPAASDFEFFESKVRPVLAGACVRCHGPKKASGGLRLDSRAALLRGGESGPAVAVETGAGADESLILRAVRRLDDDVAPMPPDKPLGPESVAALRRWVAAGMPWPEQAAPIRAVRHWAFEPVRAVAPPSGPAATAIDAFLAAAQREKGVAPAPPADKPALIRRATFDLTGLPPSPEEVERFLADDSPGAFDAVLDRLLASPRHGEKWGRAWLDVARYADTAGETADFPVPDAWRYRDYVIGAMNADVPFDRFLREQIAGDLLARELPADAPPERYAELVAATGYLAVARRFGFDTSKDQHLTIDDTIDAFSKGMLGLTVACARCHDHKYDPVSAEDYYALYGIFDSTRYPFPGCEKDRVPRDNPPLVSPAELARRLETLKARDATKATIDAFAGSLPRAYAVAEGEPRDARVMLKGDPETLGPVVPRRFLDVLGGQPVSSPSGGSGRRDLAKWVTDPSNPLTPRAIVNRVWQGHFGVGLVATPDNLGARGEPPTHPALLDWLTARFLADGWSLKRLHRLIMRSDAYRRSTATDDRNGALDPDNLTLGRFNRRRLAAEEIRDALLFVSGDLDSSPGGPHPFPDPKTWAFTQHNPFTAVYDHNRRGVYLMTQRIKRHPFLALFDGADPNSCTGRRDSTTVPTQALFFMNDPFVHARADGLARRLAELPAGPGRLDLACRLLFGRPPSALESAVSARFLAACSTGDAPAPDRLRVAWSGWLRVLFASNEFIYIN